MIIFSKAEVKDAEEIVKAKVEAFTDEVKLYGFGPDGYDNVNIQREIIKRFNSYKIMDGEKIIGGITCIEKTCGEFLISGLYVMRAYQNKGVGTMAIKFIEKEYPHGKVWTLETPYKSFRNHHFYEKMGYKKVGESNPIKEKSDFYLFKYEKVK